MKKITALVLACSLAASTSVIAETAKSEKQANRSVELRQAIFSLLGANMGTLGAMAKGKIPLDAKVIETNATRLNQLSLMIDDYTRVDTTSFDVNTEALDKVWNERSTFEKHIKDLTMASKNLQTVASSGDEGAIKKAIGGVGKTCGGCHDIFKKD